MVTPVTKRRYGAERCGGGTAPPLRLGETVEGALGRAPVRCWECVAWHVPNAVEV